MQKVEVGKKIPIATDVYQKLEERGAEHSMTPGQYATELVEKQVKSDAQKTETFFSKRHINHPRTIILLTRISSRKLRKLQEWLDSRDQIEICPHHGSGEIFLFNATKRPR
jgi:hypothetical protein